MVNNVKYLFYITLVSLPTDEQNRLALHRVKYFRQTVTGRVKNLKPCFELQALGNPLAKRFKSFNALLNK